MLYWAYNVGLLMRRSRIRFMQRPSSTILMSKKAMSKHLSASTRRIKYFLIQKSRKTTILTMASVVQPRNHLLSHKTRVITAIRMGITQAITILILTITIPLVTNTMTVGIQVIFDMKIAALNKSTNRRIVAEGDQMLTNSFTRIISNIIFSVIVEHVCRTMKNRVELITTCIH